MWLKLVASEDREKLIEIASQLRQLGAKVELREVVEWEKEERFVISGKLSELKKHKGKEVSERALEWERRIEILREILSKEELSYEEFIEKFLSREDSKRYDLFKKLLNGEFEDLADQTEDILKVKLLLDELEQFLQQNRFEVDETVRGELPEDPEISIFSDTPIEGGKKIVLIDYFPVFELVVDALSLLGKEVDVEELKYQELIISNILFNVEKIDDIDKLREFSKGIVEEGDEEILINCEEIFDQIVKSLEKFGLLRVSGKKIKPRKR